MKRYTKILMMILLVCFTFYVLPVSAQFLDKTVGDDVIKEMKDAGKDNYATGGDKNNFLLAKAFGTIVSAILGLLGIIFLIMIIMGGFNWMTAAGNEDKVTKARQTITRGVVGLIIIVAAYVISAFVFKALEGVIGV